MKHKKIIKYVGLSIAVLLCLTVAVMVVCDLTVGHAAKDKLYDSVEEIPHRKVGLVLGTSPVSSWNGRRNYYFDQRIKAAAALYKAKK